MSRKRETKIEMYDGTVYIVCGGRRISDVIRDFSVYIQPPMQNGHEPERQLLLSSALVERDSYTGWKLCADFACKVPAKHEGELKKYMNSNNGLHR
jgi:hypothetical protein